jgi:CRISPR-associated protein Cmr4
LHALSPLHAGVGQAAELIDLPIARLKGTGIPYVPGSSIKGVLRDARNGSADVAAVFGPDTEHAGEHAGALVCTDARLLALPVRSFRGTFAFVTCPLLLALAARDLERPPPIPELTGGRCLATPEIRSDDGKLYLEDLDLEPAGADQAFEQWRQCLAPVFGSNPQDQRLFTSRFAVVDDETMTFLWETATQLDQRVRINPDTRTVAKGALWLEESLPPETLLIGLLLAEPSRKRGHPLSEDRVLDVALPARGEQILQFGGKSTVGRGRCRMVALIAAATGRDTSSCSSISRRANCRVLPPRHPRIGRRKCATSSMSVSTCRPRAN